MESQKRVDVRGIVREYLEEHGYDGLCTEECGCGLEDLFPCDSPYGDCVPAYKHVCRTCHSCGEDEPIMVGGREHHCFKPWKQRP